MPGGTGMALATRSDRRQRRRAVLRRTGSSLSFSHAENAQPSIPVPFIPLRTSGRRSALPTVRDRCSKVIGTRRHITIFPWQTPFRRLRPMQ